MLASLLILAAAASGSITVFDDPRPDTVAVGLGGKLLTGPNGSALYTYDGDAANNPCRGDCLAAWPPLTAKPGDKPIGDWKPHPRAEGMIHWFYQGKPVYLYAGDRRPGIAAGDGAGGTWHAMLFGGAIPKIATPPAARVWRIDKDFFLANSQGFTLYAFSRDGTGVPACHAECLEAWPPLLAPALAGPVGEWMPVDRPDGLRQWAWRGHLLYTFNEDLAPGDHFGANAGSVWETVKVTRRDEKAGP